MDSSVLITRLLLHKWEFIHFPVAFARLAWLWPCTANALHCNYFNSIQRSTTLRLCFRVGCSFPVAALHLHNRTSVSPSPCSWSVATMAGTMRMSKCQTGQYESIVFTRTGTHITLPVLSITMVPLLLADLFKCNTTASIRNSQVRSTSYQDKIRGE